MKENKFIYGSSRSFLMDYAIKRESAKVTSDGVLCVETGSRTGRSVKDRYIVMDSKTIDTVNWGKTSNPYSNENFKKIWEKACAYQGSIECFVSDLQVGDDDKYGIGVKVITEYAWHQLFVRNLFVREISINIDEGSQWTLLSLPGFNLDPEVDKVNSEAGLFIDFTNKSIRRSHPRCDGSSTSNIN